MRERQIGIVSLYQYLERVATMEKVKIIPLVGIEFAGVTVALSSSREDVKKSLGEPYSIWKNALFYFNNELRFDFDNDGKVEFIEFLGGIAGKLQPIIYGVSVFQSKADDLYDILRPNSLLFSFHIQFLLHPLVLHPRLHPLSYLQHLLE